MAKKLTFFPQSQPETKRDRTKWELIGAAEYAKSPEHIARLVVRLAFIREEKQGFCHVRR